MTPSIAIVGFACVYPDARSPAELWENVLAQRRAFRRLPPERLRLEDYFSSDIHAPDTTYAAHAAVIEGYEFDRVGFRVAGSTFRAADLAHWLALDVAARALADAGFPDGRGLPREAAGVMLGNTLTGEFSRANTLRLRWPYVRRVLEAALTKEHRPAAERENFLQGLEAEYKSPFPPVGEESLAGGLSNTIAGRICNHFDLKGGGFTVDGACASSLLAVANACSALTAGDLDVALAGGVDLSLDPFELVGFAKAGALASDEMRVFDQRSNGFWPGEGCGMVTLMRHEDALGQGRRVYAVIRGWGISSDGAGGLTRPEAAGQMEALRRAYRRAGFGMETVSYCEGHGTGTAVGDAIELESLSSARRAAGPGAPPAVIGSVKANIGHTKAAAGIAGLINATMAVHTQVLPPMTSCEEPHALLAGPAPVLRVLREPEIWPANRPLRASVSAMGFGGINAHVVLEGVVAERRSALSSRERSLGHAWQDGEVFFLSAETLPELREQIGRLLPVAERLSRAEMADAAAQLARLPGPGMFRGAVIATRPEELAERLRTLQAWLLLGVEARLDFSGGVFLGSGRKRPRIGFLFPGQGSPAQLDGGLWRRRFAVVRDLYAGVGLPADSDLLSTRVAQPALVTASLAGLRVLADLGVQAEIAVGHSLGEIAALHWGGAFDEAALLRLAQLRGEAMAELGSPGGAMLAVAAPWPEVQILLDGKAVTIAGFNSPRQTVVAGDAGDVAAVARAAEARGWRVTPLPVSHAFHTPLVSAAVPVLAEELARMDFAPLQRHVLSTVLGDSLRGGEDLRDVLCRQITSPVRFSAALERMTGSVDLLIEVGPGEVLSALVRESAATPVAPLHAGEESLWGLLGVLGSAFALGAPLAPGALFADRFTRPFDLDARPKFFANPCESAPVPEADSATARGGSEPVTWPAKLVPLPDPEALAAIELVRRLVAERAELPVEAVRAESRLLNDLHLNSITVGELVSAAARKLNLPRIIGLTDFANATVAEVARALEDLKLTGGAARPADWKHQPPGVDAWFETFEVELVASPRTPMDRSRAGSRRDPGGDWRVFGPADHPLVAKLRAELAAAGGRGVALYLPERCGETHIWGMLEAARAVAASADGPGHFLVVQHGGGGGAFARTFHLETPGLTTCVVNVPEGHSRAAEWAASEALVADGYCEAHYDADGRRFEPRLRWRPVEQASADAGEGKSQSETRAKARPEYPIGPGDVLLVTGGGKGIAAECALAAGRASGASLALLGRSDPDSDELLRANLTRIRAQGVKFHYVRADVTDADSVRAAVQEAEKELGLVTALLHGAGANQPQLIARLDEAAFRRTTAPKISGLRNILAALDPKRLKLLVTFGSIIARAGLRGEADYAVANEWLTSLTEDFAAANPRCLCLALEWSVWSGVGMGERLGRVESLIQQDITPIPPDEGVRIFLELVRNCRRKPGGARAGARAARSAIPGRGRRPVAMVVTGRFGQPPTLKFEAPQLPLRRFLERSRVHYPGIELVVDAELSVASDPYLNDHVLHKQRLLPAVLGLEAMAQVAMALAGSETVPGFEKVELIRPIVIAEKHATTIRVSALRRGAGLIEVCVRSEETDFQADHFRVLCRFGATAEGGAARLAVAPMGPELLALDPQKDLYGRILFHGGRFRRLRGYRLLRARECVAELTPDDGGAWFGRYLPGAFVLGNPAGRDAALHAIQACIPHQRILPIGIDSLIIRRVESGPRLVRARQRERNGNDFVYDVEVTTPAGEVVECWMGLRLRAVELMTAREDWPDALFAPYLERRLEELVADANVSVVWERHESRAALRDAAMQRALGAPGTTIWRRPDGRPVTAGQEYVSQAHTQNVTLAVARTAGVACDLETVTARGEAVWRELLGEDLLRLAGRISHEQSESVDLAATRLWGALECLKKAGVAAQAPLVHAGATADGWVLLRSGSLTVATSAASLRGTTGPLVAAVAMHGPAAALAAAGQI